MSNTSNPTMIKRATISAIAFILIILLVSIIVCFLIVIADTTIGADAGQVSSVNKKERTKSTLDVNGYILPCENDSNVKDSYIADSEKIHPFPRFDETENDYGKAFLKLIEQVIAYYEPEFAKNPISLKRKWKASKRNKRFDLGDRSIEVGRVKIVCVLIIEGETKIEVALKNGWQGRFSLCTDSKASQMTHDVDNRRFYKSTTTLYGDGFWISDFLTEKDIAPYLTESEQGVGLSVAMCTDFISSINDFVSGIRFNLAKEEDVYFVPNDTNIPYELVANRQEYGMTLRDANVKHPRHVIIDWNYECSNPTHTSCIAKYGVDYNEVFQDAGFRIQLIFKRER